MNFVAPLDKLNFIACYQVSLAGFIGDVYFNSLCPDFRWLMNKDFCAPFQYCTP